MTVTSGGHNELSNLIGQGVRNVEDNNKNRCVCVWVGRWPSIKVYTPILELPLHLFKRKYFYLFLKSGRENLKYSRPSVQM